MMISQVVSILPPSRTLLIADQVSTLAMYGSFYSVNLVTPGQHIEGQRTKFVFI